MAHDSGAIIVDLRPISTPSEHCLVLTAGTIREDHLLAALERRFDQLPVLDKSGRLLGLIATEDAQHLHVQGEVLEAGHSALHLREVPAQIDLFELLSVMKQHRAVVFREHPTGQPPNELWFALVTLSDLNRHHFRAYLYPLFARLESALAELIRLTYDNPWHWIKWTMPHNQATIIGRWEMDKRENIETSAVNGCELRDLVHVLKCSTVLKKELKLADDEVAKLATLLPDLRNAVMHPVCALVHTKKTVGQMRTALQVLVRFTDSAELAVHRKHLNVSALRLAAIDPTTGWHPLMADRMHRSMDIANKRAPNGWSLHAEKSSPIVAQLTVGNMRVSRMGRDLNEILIDKAFLQEGQIDRLGSVTFVPYPDASELKDPRLVQIPTEDIATALKLLHKAHERTVVKLAQRRDAKSVDNGIYTGELVDHLYRITGKQSPTSAYATRELKIAPP